MSEKRFEVVLNEFDEVEYVMDKEMMEDRDFAEFMLFVEELAKGNEQLRKHIQALQESETSSLQNSIMWSEQVRQLEDENEQLRKIGVMYQGHNPCSNCTYCLEDKLCCGINFPILCDEMKKDYFVYGLCKKHKQIQKSVRRYDDE